MLFFFSISFSRKGALLWRRSLSLGRIPIRTALRGAIESRGAARGKNFPCGRAERMVGLARDPPRPARARWLCDSGRGLLRPLDASHQPGQLSLERERVGEARDSCLALGRSSPGALPGREASRREGRQPASLLQCPPVVSPHLPD